VNIRLATKLGLVQQGAIGVIHVGRQLTIWFWGRRVETKMSGIKITDTEAQRTKTVDGIVNMMCEKLRQREA